MPQHALPRRICRDCDGFAAVAISTGNRHRDGSRGTIRVTCPTQREAISHMDRLLKRRLRTA